MKAHLYIYYSFFTWLVVCVDTRSYAEDKQEGHDARVEWPVPTSVFQHLCGNEYKVLQVGYLRSDANTGALIIAWNGKTADFRSLRLLRLSEAWGTYVPFELLDLSDGEKNAFMMFLVKISGILEKEVSKSIESKKQIGDVESPGGCFVIEILSTAGFRQVVSQRRGADVTPVLKPVVVALDWWLRSYVSLVNDSRTTPKWEGVEVPVLPVKAHF